jgi:hypothetical protein
MGAFQWVTTNPNKKFLLRLHSRRGLWAIAANRSPPGLPSAPRSSLAELLIAEPYSNDVRLIQENQTLIALTVGLSPCRHGRPRTVIRACPGYPRRQRFKDGATWGGPQAKFCKAQSFRPCRAHEQFDAPNHVNSRDKPGHDALKFVRVDPGPTGLIQSHFSRKSTCLGSISPQTGFGAGFVDQCIR